jgi:DNA repair protein RadC
MSVLERLFGRPAGDSGMPKALRLRVIRPVFESVTIQEENGAYLFGEPLTCSQSVFETFRFLQQETKEHFVALHLDSKNRLVCIDLVASGSMSACIVHPREVFKSALLSSAAALILVHNHPSGDPSPSREDTEITKRLREAGDLLGVRVLDHIIIGETYLSMADRGLF